ncbi:MAG: PCRF domain-containing protein, partial [Zetaproteobacteria bacterium]|nr:PCRF domain-containing protein [Zetaproteobacteria bacterium]
MKTSIANKLEQIEERHNEVSALLADAETIADQDRYRNLSVEYAQLTPVVDTFKAWRQAQDDLESAQEMLRDPDPDIKNMAEEELENARTTSSELELEIQKLLLPKDPHDNSNIFLEIRAGTGGDEAAIFAG